MTKILLGLTCAALIALTSACSTAPRVAQNKSAVVNGKKLDFGGSYDTRAKEVTLSVNGDPIMRGRFPPFTTSLQLNGQYQGMDISASCRFGSVLSSMGGLPGTVAGAVQAGIGKGGDKCEISANAKLAETLYF